MTGREVGKAIGVSLKGHCVICNEPMDERDFDRQEAILATGPIENIFCHARHLTEDGPDGPKYKAATKKMAVEYALRNKMARPEMMN